MHKDYINKQNVPGLKLYTCLLFFFYLFTGVNFIFTATLNCENDGTVLRAFVLIGILFFILAPVAILDKRRENRSIVAVIASAVVHCLCTVLCSVMFHFAQVYIVYLAELTICFLCLVMNRVKKNRYLSHGICGFHGFFRGVICCPENTLGPAPLLEDVSTK